MSTVKRGMLAIAIGLIMSGGQHARQGYELKYKLENAYRSTGSGKASRAAHYKRLAKKRANMRARSKK